MTAIFNASSDVAVRKYTIQILRLTWSFFHPGGALAICHIHVPPSMVTLTTFYPSLCYNVYTIFSLMCTSIFTNSNKNHTKNDPCGTSFRNEIVLYAVCILEATRMTISI